MTENNKPTILTLDDGKIVVLGKTFQLEVDADGNVVACTDGKVQQNAPHTVEVGDVAADGTVYAGISPDTGEELYAASQDAPMTMLWDEAMEYAADSGMRLPTRDELELICQTEALSDTFNKEVAGEASIYWSSTVSGPEARSAAIMIMPGNISGWSGKERAPASVRLVYTTPRMI